MYDDVDLQPGERLLWSGKPERYPFFVAGDLLGVPFSLIWLAFAGFWLWNVWWASAPGFFLIWGSLFVLVGLYMATGRYLVRWIRLRSTRYAITSLRVIEIIDRPWRKRTEDYLRYLPPPVYRGDGMRGSAAFGQFPAFLHEAGFNTRRRSGERQPIVLREIAQPRHVRDIIASAQTQKA